MPLELPPSPLPAFGSRVTPPTLPPGPEGAVLAGRTVLTRVGVDAGAVEVACGVRVLVLSAFGVYWTGEGLGISWPGHDLAILVFAALFLVTGLLLCRVLGQSEAETPQ